MRSKCDMDVEENGVQTGLRLARTEKIDKSLKDKQGGGGSGGASVLIRRGPDSEGPRTRSLPS